MIAQILDRFCQFLLVGVIRDLNRPAGRPVNQNQETSEECMTESEKAEQILENCKDLIQAKGYHRFSLTEIAQLAGTSTGNLYHHFKSKSNLVRETIIKYKEDFSTILTQIEQDESSLRGRLESLINNAAKVLEPDNTKICLCMMLMIEINTLPPSIIEELNKFFDLQVDWIIKIFSQDENTSTLLNYEAQMIITSLEGTIAVARMKGGSQYFKNVAYSLLDNFMIAHQKVGIKR